MQQNRLNPCRNCGERPVIVEQLDHFRFRLEHKNPICPGQYHFESHQHSEAACADSWNKHNTTNQG